MSGLKELPYLMPFKTLLAYSPIKILAVRNVFILCFMWLEVMISGEDCYGGEVHWLIRFIPLRVESEFLSLFNTVMFSLSKCWHWYLTFVSWKFLQALLHASIDCRRKLVVDWVASTDLEDSTAIEVWQPSIIQHTQSYGGVSFSCLLLNFTGTWCI